MRTTAMSSSGAVASTRAGCVAPSGRRIVTETFPATTWTFVRIVSGATKKPVPYAPPASTRTTAGIARLITSSSDGTAGAPTAGVAALLAGMTAGEAPAGGVAVRGGTISASSRTAGAAVRTAGRAGTAGAAAGGVGVWPAKRYPATTLETTTPKNAAVRRAAEAGLPAAA